MGFLGNLWDDITGVSAAKEAGSAQQATTQAALDLQREQFGIMQGNLAPYMTAGTDALQSQQALAGALGPEAQQAAIASIQAGPGFQSALQQGETSILQNASATGGVRGGNTQGALAQYSPQLLNQAINQQYSQLGGLSGMGQASAAGVGSAAMNMGQSMGGMMMQQGQNQASNILGQYNLQRNFVGDVAGFGMNLAQLGIL